MNLTKDPYKFLELKEKLKILKNTLSNYEIKLAEIRNARVVLEKSTGAIYRKVDNLMIQVDRDEALDYIEKTENIFKSQIEKIKKEISKVSEELKNFDVEKY